MSYFESLCFLNTSFFPLWIAVLILDIKSIFENKEYLFTEIASIIGIVIFFSISAIVLVCKINKAKRKNRKAQIFLIESVQKQKSVTAEFVLTFIMPLIAFDFTHWYGVLLFAIFFSLLSFLCAKHSYFSVNVLLELFGYRFFVCNLMSESGNCSVEKTIISRDALSAKINTNIHISSINNEFAIEV